MLEEKPYIQADFGSTIALRVGSILAKLKTLDDLATITSEKFATFLDSNISLVIREGVNHLILSYFM